MGIRGHAKNLVSTKCTAATDPFPVHSNAVVAYIRLPKGPDVHLQHRLGEGGVARVYSWTDDEDEIAPDAVTVGIRSDTRILTIAGLQFGQRDAAVYWPD